MRHLRQAGAVLALMLVAVSTASAQRTTTRQAASSARPWELGLDAALSFMLDDPNVVSLSIPAGGGLFGLFNGTGGIRAGYHMSDVLSIEPFASINYFDSEGTDGTTVYQFGVGGLYHFSPDRTRTQLFVRPFLSLNGVSTEGASDSEIGIGVGGGFKWPKLNGRMALRSEANLFLINETTSINFLFGVSFFTR